MDPKQKPRKSLKGQVKKIKSMVRETRQKVRKTIKIKYGIRAFKKRQSLKKGIINEQ